MDDNEIKNKNLDKNSNDESQKDEKIENSKKIKKPKIEINFETYLKEKKSKIDELKNFFDNSANDTNIEFSNLSAINYNDDTERREIIKKLIALYVPSKKVKLSFNYKRLIYEFIISELIKFNVNDPMLKTLDLDDLKNTFLPHVGNYETVIKLSNFFCSKNSKDETDDKTFEQNRSVFLDIVKLYVNFMVDTVNWLTIEQIMRLIEAIENFKPQQFSEKKVLSNSLYFINKSDFIFTFRELFQPYKKQVQQLNAISNSNENTISKLREVIDHKDHELVELKNRKLELTKEKEELEQNIATLKLKGDANQAGSWQEKNEIIGRFQNKLTSFLNYELHIATEAVLNGEQGAMKASKMIDKLITKIKEEKEWLSSLD